MVILQDIIDAIKSLDACNDELDQFLTGIKESYRKYLQRIGRPKNGYVNDGQNSYVDCTALQATQIASGFAPASGFDMILNEMSFSAFNDAADSGQIFFNIVIDQNIDGIAARTFTGAVKYGEVFSPDVKDLIIYADGSINVYATPTVNVKAVGYIDGEEVAAQ